MVTNRDLKIAHHDDDLVSTIMNPLEKLTTMVVESIRELPSLPEIKDLMVKKRVEKIPIINKENEIIGLATLKDIERLISRPTANLDSRGKYFYIG
jgi:IMP dehydrogenase